MCKGALLVTDILDSVLSDARDAGPAVLHRVRVTAVTADSAAVSYVDDGREVSGVLPVSAANPRFSWSAGSVFDALRISDAPHVQFSCSDVRVVERLYASVVPDIRSGDVVVMGVVRVAGARTKIAVASTREGLDPVAALIGRGHNRVDYVKAALGGEQVDVIAWNPVREVFLSNALQPARVSDVRIDESAEVGYARVESHQMAAAVGGKGLNSLLAGELVGLQQVKILSA